MKHDRQIITLCIMIAFCLGLATWAPADTEVPENGLETYILKTKKAKKPASFPHWAHSETLKNDCAWCHEDERFIEIAEIGWSKKRGHDTCKACHKKFDAPTKCSTCHPKSIQPKKKAYEGC